ncbi:UbiA family prenyltransferase [Microbacterium karelineae]|uniref:UbiA family prenyltransferase n=1 Tax=Microbacterium karelineae TaxID=2654283 RepID=UPI0012EAD447|nr:UbiA family prenyltransferase [Microbacterium karelineae]
MRISAVLWRSTHPGPTLVVTAIALGLGLSAGLGPVRLAVLVAAVFAGQVSIGLSNDAIDAPRDRLAGRPDKPLAPPGAPLRAAWTAAGLSAVVAVVLSAALGWQLAAAHIAFVGAGWAYNAGVKSTAWSALCFAVGFGILPSLAPLALADPRPAPTWAWIAGACLGLAVHFSNVLPDLDDDARTGVRGLPHRFGRRWSAVSAFAALVAGAAVVATGPPAGDPGVAALRGLGFLTVAGIAAWGLVASTRGAPSRRGFRLVMIASLVLVLQLVLTGEI